MKAYFGPGGNSEAFKLAGGKSTLDAPRWLSSIGLDAYEYQGGNGITASESTLAKIGEANADLEQIRIAKEILHSRRHNSEVKKLVKGMMIESYIEDGAQGVDEHIFGKSITL